MIKKIILFSTFLVLASCGQNEIDFSQISTRNGLAYQVNENSPFTGKVSSKLENGQIIISGSYKNGKKDGEWLEYFNNGQLKKKENYSSGNYDGKFESYNKDGSPVILTNYSNGKLNNNYKEYNRKNILISDINYDNGNYNGSFKKFNDNGILITSTNYKNGSIDGLYTNYYENGNKKLEYSMSNNNYVNEYTMYNNDGVVKTQFDYSSGSKKNKGTWKKYWNKDWKIVDNPSTYYSTVSFDNSGKPSTRVKFYYQKNNKIQSEHTYLTVEPDLKEGEAIWYSEDGGITMKGNFKNGKRDGLWETYYKTNNYVGTKIKERANYKNGNLNGNYIIYKGGEEFKNPSTILGIRFQTIDGYWKATGNIQGQISDVTFKVWLIDEDNGYGLKQKCSYKMNYYVKHINKKYSNVNSYLEQNNRKFYDINGNLYRGQLKDKRNSNDRLFCK